MPSFFRLTYSKLVQWLALLTASIVTISDTDGEPLTWIDNDNGNVISFDGDQGWKIWQCANTNNYCQSMVPFCNDTSECRREDSHSGKVYYGPFNNDIDDSKWFERRFACEETSNVSVSLQVSSCNSRVQDAINNEDDITLWINHNRIGKFNINSTNGDLIDDNGALSEDDCTSFFTEIITPENTVTVAGLDRFEIQFRHRNRRHAESYIHDIEVTCTPTEDTDSTRSTGTDGSGESTHETYCVSGFTDTLDHFNGEYPLYVNSVEDPIEDANGFSYFHKHDYNGEAFMYLVQNRTWVIGDTLNGDNWVWSCSETVDPSLGGFDYFLDIAEKCNSGSADSDDEIFISEDECEDHHTRISSLLSVGVEDVVTNAVDYAGKHPLNLAMMMVFVSVFVCMCLVTCVMCVKMKRKEPYGKMINVDGDISSDDTDVTDDEISAI